jgi:hypothetical protein
MSKITDQDKQIMEKLCGKELSEQEIFENRQDLFGAIAWLDEMDKKYNPRPNEN